MFNAELMSQIRDRFIHVDSCPYQGPRIYFENAGGSLTLKSVIEVNTHFAGMPDNHGRDNPASKALTEIIEQGRKDIRLFLGVKSGPVFMVVRHLQENVGQKSREKSLDRHSIIMILQMSVWKIMPKSLMQIPE